MFIEHKKKIIAGIAIAFLAAFAVFYDGVVRVITDTLITPAETSITETVSTESVSEQITDAVTTD